MSITFRIFIFILAFSGVFFFFRTHESVSVLMEEVVGLPWLYSAIATLFSFIAAFIIQKEWELWNYLSDKTQGEVSVLRELISWGKLDQQVYPHIKLFVEVYIKCITEEWGRGGAIVRNKELDNAIEVLRPHILASELRGSKFVSSTFLQLIKIRNSRLEYSTHHVPKILKKVLFFAAFLVMFLSLFIGVKHVLLDYIFTLSIATLIFSLYEVIDDLDNPFRPGVWHLTPDSYKELLLIL